MSLTTLNALITYPDIRNNFTFVDRLGTGSQATVDLYRKKIEKDPNSGHIGDKKPEAEDHFAVKKYRIQDEGNIDELIMLFNEINFLRDFKICENIIQIEQVYSYKNPNGRKMIYIVMKFARYGSLLRLILRKCQFKEA